MASYLTFDFLLPLCIGIACLIFAARIPFAAPQAAHEYEEDFHQHPGNEGADDLFPHDTAHDIKDLSPDRKALYIVLFGGLGIAAILIAFSALHDIFSLAAKLTVGGTLIGAFLVSRHYDRKTTENENGVKTGQPRS